MDLSYRDLGGQGPAIVILHGLFGSSQNWAGMGRRLSAHGRVFALDLRNHGDSPRASTHTLTDCVEDLRDWSRARGLETLRLIGHSMGGLVAMGFAVRHPSLTAGIAAVDIAPRPYPPGHEEELRALRTDIGACRSRAELDCLLSSIVPQVDFRQFLLTNAVREGPGFRWRIDAEVLAANTVAADWAGVSGSYEGESLLIACGRSDYVRAEDHALMRRFFPNARIQTIPQADHWPHVSAPGRMEELLGEFLVRCNKNEGSASLLV
ncbi:MAG: alpha/beta fold hydrolase [Spirochaetia bacterium]|jgi:pimeloyl-ACP methyl ester carboxylesterase